MERLTLGYTIPWFTLGSLHVELPRASFLPEYIDVSPFGLFVIASVVTGVLVARWRAMRSGLDATTFGECAGYVLVGAFLLAHPFDALLYHFDLVAENPAFLLELSRGMSSFGGFFGAIVGGAIWAVRRRASLVRYADPIAWAFPFGFFLGRVGCAIAHDHPGRISDFALAVRDYRIDGVAPPWPARHDLGLYEALVAIAIGALFLWLDRLPRREGFYLALLPILYAPARFTLDFLRATDVPGADPRWWLGWTPGQYASIAMFVLGLLAARRIAKAQRHDSLPSPSPSRSTPTTTTTPTSTGRSRDRRR